MQPRKYLLATCSVLLVAALLAACAAPAAPPTATPVPPTPIPPAPTPSLLDFAKAYESAWNSFDPDALTALFAEPFTYTGYPITDVTAWAQGWPYGMAMGLQMKIELRDCREINDTITCTVRSDTDCFDMDVTEAYTVKDGKITDLVHSENLEDSRQWDQYSSNVEMWARSQKIEEWPAYENEVAKGAYGYEWGTLFTALCRKYEDAVQTQAPATAAAAQGLVEALNSGDTDGALAYFMEADDVSFKVLSDEAQGAEQMLAMFDWLAGKGTQFQITDCEWQGIGTQCAASLVDGCIAASGAPEGANGKMTFYSQEDGTLRRVNVMMELAERKAYNDWQEAEAA